MKVEIVISTMNLSNYNELLKKMNILENINSELYVTIINQQNGIELEQIYEVNKNIKVVNSSDIGIGKSRNLGIKYINNDSDIICFTDDDVIYNSDFCNVINGIFTRYPYIDAAAFNVCSLNSYRKIKSISRVHKINKYNCLRYGMYNFAIKSSVIKKLNLSFSEKFGGNSKYLSGEDSLFIYNLVKMKNTTILALPITVGNITHESSTWYNMNGTKEYYISKGALFYAIDKRLYKLYILYFALRYSSRSLSNLNFALSMMKNGARKYKMEDE